MNQKEKFATLVERVLNNVVQNYVLAPADRDTISAIRRELRVRMNEMFSRCDFKLSTSSVGWLSDEYFKCVRFKSSDGVEVKSIGRELMLFDQPDIRQLPISDVQIMANLFGITDFGDKLEEELRRRSN